MENIQAQELRENVQECCPNIFDLVKTVSGLDMKACCGIPSIILENTIAPSKDSFESINQKTSLAKRALRRVKELNFRNIYHLLRGNNKNNVNQLALVPDWKDLRVNPHHTSMDPPLWNNVDTLTQFTKISFFYKV
ncbi:MAG: hypothetical protein ISS66_04020 [Desulfobacteraceae bacterium]|nr:hypothetical protein [Desulfobacteraceae bacterium]